jgi:hypothetical protein
MKCILLFAILFIESIANNAGAQVYTIESLDGAIQKIHVLPDDEKGTLNISYLNDTLHVGEFEGVQDSIAVLDRKFLKIVYSVRGGSGIHLRHTLLLCVRNGILYQSIHITSVFDEEFIDFSKKVDSLNPVDKKSVYELKLNLLGSNMQNYKLNINLHDEKRSKHDTLNNYNHNEQVVLNFDTSQNIFYGSNESISEYFTVYDPKTQKEHKEFIMGTFPVILLGTFNYYYIKDEWYERNDFNELGKYSYRQ